MPANFNDATAYQTFPTLSLTKTQLEVLFPDTMPVNLKPTVGDPGFIVESTSGGWGWCKTLPLAREAAGTTEAIYMAVEVCPEYFGQFAREERINKDGTETDLGPYQG